MALFKFIIYSPYVGADVTEEIEVSDEDLAGLSDEEQKNLLDEETHKWMLRTVEYGWRKL